MSIKLDLTAKPCNGSVNLPPSKSLLNRVLLLQALFPQIAVANFNLVDDVKALQDALATEMGAINVGASGTAMRFACAYYAAKNGVDVTLSGTLRMHSRPIAPLVNALNRLGADIAYLSNEGYPPLSIKGKQLLGGDIEIDASLSSQFLSALMLVAPTFQKGLKMRLAAGVVSKPYINMTADVMNKLGFQVHVADQYILVEHVKDIEPITYHPEADWSAAAYWYAFVALHDEASVQLDGLHQQSLQGDCRLQRIFEALGVKSTFNKTGVLLTKRPAQLPSKLVINLLDNPDLAQPLAFACAALGIGADFHGLQTLRFKETDRLQAMKTELARVGADVVLTDTSLAFNATRITQPDSPFETYKDHRMAMSAAILATQFPVEIKDPNVVSKSYPNFWADISSLYQTSSPQ